ncbi:hypothetical protein ACQPZZ_31545 [Microbispora sp. CA-135349]|uniref:hypothetical protein n=1 Tax=Microbispora sp. CA-135349 TaxID=3239953 RepID=UPI003D919771
MPEKPLSQRETAILLLLMAEAREFTNPELDEQFGLKIEKGEREHLHRLKLIDVGKRGQAFTYTLSEDGWATAAEIFRNGVPRSSRLAARALEAVVRAMVSGLLRHMERTGSPLAEIFGREEDLTPAGLTTSVDEPVDEPAPKREAAAVQEPTPMRGAVPPVVSLAGTPTTVTSGTTLTSGTTVTSAAAGTAVASGADVETRIRKAYAQLAGKPNAWVSLTHLRPLLADAPRDEVDATLRRMIGLPDVRLVPESNQKMLTDEDRSAAVVIGDQAKHLILIGA